MKIVEVTNEVAKDLELLAKAWATTNGDVIRRLLQEYVRPATSPVTTTQASGIAIHSIYEGRRTEARYDLATRRVDITSGPLAGQSFKSPSGAAIAVVREHNPTVNPNRNGWSFWLITESGKLLQTLRK